MRPWIVLLVLACTVIGSNQSTLSADQVPTSPPVENQPSSPQLDQGGNGESQHAILQFYSWTDTVPKDFEVMRASLLAKNYHAIIEKTLPRLAADIRDLQWNVSMNKAQPYRQKIEIDLFQRKLSILNNQLAQLKKTLREAITQLSAAHADWKKNLDILNNLIQQDGVQVVINENERQELNDIINQALALINSNLMPALDTGKAIAGLQAHLQQIETDLQHQDETIIETRFKRSSPTLLDRGFYIQIDRDLFSGSYQNGIQFFSNNLKFLKDHVHELSAGFFLLLILSATIYLSRRFVETTSYWYSFASCPIATTIFIAIISYHFLVKIANLPFGNQLSLIINIISMFAVIRLVRSCIVERWKKAAFTRLTVFMAIIMLFATLELPQVLMLIYVFLVSVVALAVYAFQFSIPCATPFQRVIRNTWGILPAIVVFTSLAGYDNLAIFVFSTCISSVYFTLIIWMLFHINCGLLALFLKFIPFSLFRDNIPKIVRSLLPFIALFHIIILVGVLLVSWDFFPSFETALESISAFSLDLFGVKISFGFVFTLFLMVYITMLFSKAVQVTLQKEILPKYITEKGVQLSITRLVHYGILTIGFIFMLKFLGFELKQLTILGGALGVGIGFGLQAIVNNFVSGLILLFERPIKVGDTIQIGDDLGEVKNLGLRATVIQTFDNSEIVVPNSDLVTGQVTNWTLAERKVRVRIPVGVAYGSDVAKVLQILTNCAESNPMVLNNPKPVALFLAFGASSLDFELRFWIPEFLDKMSATAK